MSKHPSRRVTSLAALLLLLLLRTATAVSAQIDIGLSDDEERKLEIGIKVGQTAYSLAKAMDHLTPEDEYYLGRAAAARILALYPVYEDPEALRYVNLVGDSLALASERPEVFDGYRFAILDSDEVNAFACPGALILITRGMLRLTASEDELAAVLAHEIAHIENRDGRGVIEEKRWKKFWAVAGTGAVVGLGNKVVRQLAVTLGSMSENLFVALHTKGYGKKLERKADPRAVDLLSRTGYDPHALVQVLEKLAELRKEEGKEGFLRTHPRPEGRLDELGKLRKTEPRGIPEARRARFEQALTTARSLR
jgi:predicted Zn-dependent protease